MEKGEQIANQFSTLCTRLDNLETTGEKMALQQQPDEETGQRTAAELDHLNRNKKDRSNTISQLEQKRMEQESKLRDYREKTQDLAAQKEDVETRLRELDSRSASLDAKAKDLANQEENWEVGQPRLADQEKALSEREQMLTHRNAESTNTLRQFRRKKHGASQKLPVFKSFAVALTMEDINSRKRKGSCGWQRQLRERTDHISCSSKNSKSACDCASRGEGQTRQVEMASHHASG